MNAHRPRRLFRRRTFIPAITAPLLSLVVAAGVAPCAARPKAQNKKVEVQIAASEMELCGPIRENKIDREVFCLRAKVKNVIREDRTARAQGGRVVEGHLYAIVKDHYDERGNRTLLEISDNAPGPVGVVYRRLVFSFDARGRATGWKSYEDGKSGSNEVAVYSYDGRGNRVRVETTREEPSTHAVQEFSYDAEGRRVEESYSYLSAGEWRTHRTVRAFDGNLIHFRTYSKDGTQTGKGTVINDDRGNRLGEEQYHVDARGGEHLWRKVTYGYDRRGFRTEVIYHKAEEWLGARAVYEYDERGNVTSLTRYNADGSFAVSEHREYEYDAAGNWVTRVSSSRRSEGGAAEPYRVERRRITYY